MANTLSAPDAVSAALRTLVLYALAEFQSGHATTLRVTADGLSFGIADDGRGHPLNKTLEGTPYLAFIYTHFDYPFETGRPAPIQLQGLGMSMVNALCSELVLTVTKRDESLQVIYRDGRLHDSRRTAAPSEATGITVSAKLNPQLQQTPVDSGSLEAWLQGLVTAYPTLKLFFNGQQLQSADSNRQAYHPTNHGDRNG